jgi:hypothetical protein
VSDNSPVTRPEGVHDGLKTQLTNTQFCMMSSRLPRHTPSQSDVLGIITLTILSRRSALTFETVSAVILSPALTLHSDHKAHSRVSYERYLY